MKKSHTLLAILIGIAPLQSILAETNAVIEVKLFKSWGMQGEWNFGNLAIKNTGTSPILLAKDAGYFSICQLYARSFPAKRAEYWEDEVESRYQDLSSEEVETFNLLPGETHVYEGRRFNLSTRSPFSEQMRFIVSIYLGNGFWLDSDPVVINGIVPDTVEHLATINDEVNVGDLYNLTLVTHKNERWLYSSLKISALPNSGKGQYPVCPLSLTNNIRVEPYEGGGLVKIWDGNQFMRYDTRKNMLVEGSDENNVLGKWTRERKQRAEAHNMEVRRKKAEQLETKN